MTVGSRGTSGLRLGRSSARPARPRLGLREQIIKLGAECIHVLGIVSSGYRVRRPRKHDLHAAAVRAAPRAVPVPSFEPLHPDRSKLPAIGRYFERTSALPMLRRELAQLRALGTPPKDQADWQRLLAAKQSSLTEIARQYQAALKTDVPTFVATVRALTTAQGQERTAASGFGAPGCAPPGPNQPAGRPPEPRPYLRRLVVALNELAACMRAHGSSSSRPTPPGTARRLGPASL